MKTECMSSLLLCILSKFVFIYIFILKQGPVKEVMETLQKEVLEGDLLKDCLELGSTDLKGLITVLKDISSKYTSTFSTRAELWLSEVETKVLWLTP